MLHEMSIPKYEKNTVALHSVSVLGDGLRISYSMISGRIGINSSSHPVRCIFGQCPKQTTDCNDADD